jgi:hypothetical protein
MHKSGTTLVAQILHKSGVNMGWDLKESDLDYSSQKCESPAVNEINYELLDCHGDHSLNIGPDQKLVVGPKTVEAIQNFIKQQEEKFKNWGFKDPRTVLTYPEWKEHLPTHKLVAVYRDPEGVVRHYQKKANRFKIMRAAKTLWVWKKYNLKIYSLLKDKEPGEAIVINYDRMMENDDEFKTLGAFTGRDLTDMRDPEHNRKGRELPWIYGVLKLLFGVERMMALLDEEAKIRIK